MPISNDTTITIRYQGFICEKKVEEKENRTIYDCHSEKEEDVICPHCYGRVKKHGMTVLKVYDVPEYPGKPTVYLLKRHRYQCTGCGVTFNEKEPFSCPGFHLTQNAVEWICQLLSYQITTKNVAEMMGIHWNTVRKIQKARLEYILKIRDSELLNSSYRPYFLAVDEFAIQKGHRYATCVMDLVSGDVLWVGKGRAIKDFSKFFEHFVDSDYLSKVKAVAMDMNASYNTLVRHYLPNAEIVYDRYHVQAQFGRDVLGQVRLDAARSHQERAKEMIKDETSLATDVKSEKKFYSMIKKARWILLKNHEKLSDEKTQNLNEILETHSDLALCYAMKEELVELFKITDKEESRARWQKWFDAAINSGIQPLVKFGRQKIKRLDGLVAHSIFHINTGKLEGFNNKIKVAKRNAFGFRNSNYFFSYIRYLSLPKYLIGT